MVVQVRFIIGILLILPFLSGAQADSAQLKAAFRFQDGAYLSLTSLHNNQPDYKWQDLHSKLAANAESYRAQAEYIPLADNSPLTSEDIWGIVLDGLPYILLPYEVTEDSTVLQFSGMRVRGRICYFEYQREIERLVDIKAYNPLTGRPFRRGNISKREIINEARILHLPTGYMGELNRSNLLKMIDDDQKMYRTVEELTDESSVETLYKCVLIYDDRNPMYIPVPDAANPKK